MQLNRRERRFERVDYRGTAALWRRRSPHLVKVRNLGAGGALLEGAPDDLGGTFLTLRFSLSEEIAFTVVCRVVRTGSRAPTASVAVEFVDIAPRDRERLHRFITARAA